jgi:uncharacterized protein (TIGR00251 family)
MTTLRLKVVPDASNTTVVGRLGDRLKIRVAAAPEKGKANKMVVKLLERELLLAAGSVRVIAGSTSPLKTVEIDGVSQEMLDALWLRADI